MRILEPALFDVIIIRDETKRSFQGKGAIFRKKDEMAVKTQPVEKSKKRFMEGFSPILKGF